MPEKSDPAVIVGIDGSDSALRAAEWAAHEARDRGLPVRLVHAFDWPDSLLDPNAVLARRVASTLPGSDYRQDLVRVAEQKLAEAAAAVRNVAPGAEVGTALVEGAPVHVLRSEAAHAQLAVVGTRGLGGFAGLLVGSVAIGLASHAPCPVVVVRGDVVRTSRAPVLVGFDDSEGSVRALEFAIDAARRRRVPLEVLFAWRDTYDVPGDAEGVAEAALQKIEEQLAARRSLPDEVEVRPRVVPGRPAPSLVERSAHAQLLVVGSRGRGGLGGLLLGSVSHAVLHHAECPVAVVGPAARGASPR